MSTDDKNPEDMNKEERQQYVDAMKHRHEAWLAQVPLTVKPDCWNFPGGEAVRTQIRDGQDKQDRRLRDWVEKGGSLGNSD